MAERVESPFWQRLSLPILLLAALLNVAATTPDINLWPCPNLNIDGAVVCECDMPNSLLCRNAPNPPDDADQMATLKAITATVRSLPADNRLRLLELQLDRLSDLPDDSFDGTELHALVIGPSSLTSIKPEALRGLSSTLEALAITSARLPAVPAAALATLPLITRVNLSGNNIREVTDNDFQSVTRLQEVDLTNNNVSNASAFRLNRNLFKLVLNKNRMEGASGFSIPSSDDVTFPALQELSLGQNLYRGALLAHWLPEMRRLVRLDLSGNQLERVETCAFSASPQLRLLDLSNNRITGLASGAFAGTNLSVLNLSHNRLQSWSFDAFVGLSSLIVLSLSDNHVTVLDDRMFLPLSSVRVLDLKDNDIVFIHSRAFVNAKGLQSLDLEDNPLTCDCMLRGFSTWLRQTPRLTSQEKQLATCEVPASLHGRALVDVSPSLLACTGDDTPPESLTRMEREEKFLLQRRTQSSRMSPAEAATATPPNRFDAVLKSGLTLVDYSYDLGVLVLNWTAEPELWPLECDAIFVFEERQKTLLNLREKIRTGCAQSSATADQDDHITKAHPIQVRLADVSFSSRMRYRLCLAVIHLRTLVLGCSELLSLDTDRNLLLAVVPERDDLRHHKATPTIDTDDNDDERGRSSKKERKNSKQNGNRVAEMHEKLGKSDSNHQNGDQSHNLQDSEQHQKENQRSNQKQNSNGEHRNENQNGDRRRNQDSNKRGQDPPVISIKMTDATSVHVTWKFPLNIPLPESCELLFRVMQRDHEVDRKRTTCSTPEITFSRLHLLLHDYNICAQLVANGADESSSSLQRCERVEKRKLTDYMRPNILMAIAIAFIFVFCCAVVALLMRKLTQLFCGEASPKTVGLAQACRGSTQYRVLYHQPNVE